MGVLPYPPISQSDYDWCGGKPFDIQVRTCELLTENPRSYALNSMGTGKTRCVLWSFDYLKKLGMVNKMLVVCPLSTMTFTWQHEIMKATPHLRSTVLHADASKRKKLLADDGFDIYIVNHDGVRVIYKELLERPDIDVICLDELAVYRNPTVRTKLMTKLAGTRAVVWGLTGSPMPNAVTDIWSQIRIITPHSVPKFFTYFRDELQVKVSQFKWANKIGAIEKAFAYMQPSVRYTLDDIMELPDAVVPPPMDTGLSPDQRKVYDLLRKHAVAAVKGGEITAMNAGVVMSKLLQVSSGWVYGKNRHVHDLGGSDRLQALADIIDAADGKVIVFVNYRHTLAGVHHYLSRHFTGAHLIHGETSPKERNIIFNAFQNTDDPAPLIVYPKCISHGLTLTAANTAVWYGPPLSAETYDQCNARIRRVGQKRKQLFVHLSSTPMEKRVYNLLTARLLQQDSFLSLLEDASWD
jgi:SNF2 family DNA or RNA helicase